MMEDVVGTVAVEVIPCKRNPVNGEADAILEGNVRIQSATVLDCCKFRGVHSVIVRNVGHCTKRAARGSAACASPTAARVVGISPAKSLGTQVCCQRRTDIQPA